MESPVMFDTSSGVKAPSGIMDIASQVKVESSVIVDTTTGIIDLSSGEEEDSSGIIKEHPQIMEFVAIKEKPLEEMGYEEMEMFRDENATKKRFPCPECGKGFDYKAHLLKHSRVHSGETPFVCTICKKGFKHVSHLRRHQSTHTGIKDICDICGKGFYEIGQHMKTHIKKSKPVKTTFNGSSDATIEVPDRIKCPFCTNTYANKRYMKRHLLTHQNFRPYSCEFCDKKFYQSCDLNVHRRIHLNIKPYSCDRCHKTFRTSSSLKKHTRVSCSRKKINTSTINDTTLMCEETELMEEEHSE